MIAQHDRVLKDEASSYLFWSGPNKKLTENQTPKSFFMFSNFYSKLCFDPYLNIFREIKFGKYFNFFYV